MVPYLGHGLPVGSKVVWSPNWSWRRLRTGSLPACLWPQLTGATPRPPLPSQRLIVPAWLSSRVWPHPGSHFPLGSPCTLTQASHGPIEVPAEAAPLGPNTAFPLQASVSPRATEGGRTSREAKRVLRACWVAERQAGWELRLKFCSAQVLCPSWTRKAEPGAAIVETSRSQGRSPFHVPSDAV